MAGSELPLHPYAHFERAAAGGNVVVSYLMPEGYKYRIRNSFFLKRLAVYGSVCTYVGEVKF